MITRIIFSIVIFCIFMLVISGCDPDEESPLLRRITNGTEFNVTMELYASDTSIVYFLAPSQHIDYVGYIRCCVPSETFLPWTESISFPNSISILFNDSLIVSYSTLDWRDQTVSNCSLRNLVVHQPRSGCNGYVLYKEFDLLIYEYNINEEDYLAAVPIED